MKNRCSAFFAAAFAVVAASTATAQTAPTPLKAEKAADVRYFTLETMTSKPGARTWTIISKHFLPAARAAGVAIPIVYHTETGKSQTMVITPLRGGLADLEWTMSPDDVKFMTALATQLGGADKAEAMWKEFNDGIDSRSREIIHEHTK